MPAGFEGARLFEARLGKCVVGYTYLPGEPVKMKFLFVFVFPWNVEIWERFGTPAEFVI